MFSVLWLVVVLVVCVGWLCFDLCCVALLCLLVCVCWCYSVGGVVVCRYSGVCIVLTRVGWCVRVHAVCCVVSLFGVVVLLFLSFVGGVLFSLCSVVYCC